MNRVLACLGLVCTILAAPAHASGMADRIQVGDPHVRLAPPGARATAAFMALQNDGEQPAHLVSAASDAARIVELHDHINDGGVMRMRQVKEIAVPAKGETLLKPGSYHIMLIDMKAPLKEGDHVVITLGFSDGSHKAIHATVRKPAGGAPMRHMGH